MPDRLRNFHNTMVPSAGAARPAHHQRERHHRHRGDQGRRQRHPGRPRRLLGHGGRPARPALATSTASTPPTPAPDPDARAYPRDVPALTPDILALAGGAGTALATGGMATKLRAATAGHRRRAATWSSPTGSHPSILYDIADGKPVGSQLRGAEVKDKHRYAHQATPPARWPAIRPPPQRATSLPPRPRTPTSLTITRPLLEEALAAKPALAALSSEEKKAVLLSMADALEAEHQGNLSRQCTGPGSRPGPPCAPVMQDRLRPDRRAHRRHGRRHPGRGRRCKDPVGAAPGLRTLCPMAWWSAKSPSPWASSPSSMSPGPT